MPGILLRPCLMIKIVNYLSPRQLKILDGGFFLIYNVQVLSKKT